MRGVSYFQIAAPEGHAHRRHEATESDRCSALAAEKGLSIRVETLTQGCAWHEVRLGLHWFW